MKEEIGMLGRTGTAPNRASFRRPGGPTVLQQAQKFEAGRADKGLIRKPGAPSVLQQALKFGDFGRQRSPARSDELGYVEEEKDEDKSPAGSDLDSSHQPGSPTVREQAQQFESGERANNRFTDAAYVARPSSGSWPAEHARQASRGPLSPTVREKALKYGAVGIESPREREETNQADGRQRSQHDPQYGMTEGEDDGRKSVDPSSPTSVTDKVQFFLGYRSSSPTYSSPPQGGGSPRGRGQRGVYDKEEEEEDADTFLDHLQPNLRNKIVLDEEDEDWSPAPVSGRRPSYWFDDDEEGTKPASPTVGRLSPKAGDPRAGGPSQMHPPSPPRNWRTGSTPTSPSAYPAELSERRGSPHVRAESSPHARLGSVPQRSPWDGDYREPSFKSKPLRWQSSEANSAKLGNNGGQSPGRDYSRFPSMAGESPRRGVGEVGAAHLRQQSEEPESFRRGGSRQPSRNPSMDIGRGEDPSEGSARMARRLSTEIDPVLDEPGARFGREKSVNGWYLPTRDPSEGSARMARRLSTEIDPERNESGGRFGRKKSLDGWYPPVAGGERRGRDPMDSPRADEAYEPRHMESHYPSLSRGSSGSEGGGSGRHAYNVGGSRRTDGGVYSPRHLPGYYPPVADNHVAGDELPELEREDSMERPAPLHAPGFYPSFSRPSVVPSTLMDHVDPSDLQASEGSSHRGGSRRGLSPHSTAASLRSEVSEQGSISHAYRFQRLNTGPLLQVDPPPEEDDPPQEEEPPPVPKPKLEPRIPRMGEPPMDEDDLPKVPTRPSDLYEPIHAPKPSRARGPRRAQGDPKHLKITLPSSLPGIAKILAPLLLSEPTTQYIFPLAASRQEWMLSYCKGLLNSVMNRGGVIAVAGTEPALIQSSPGVIAAYPPGTYPPGKIKSSTVMWNLVIAARNKTKAALIKEGTQVYSVLEENHPKTPHWFIAALGVNSERRKQGIATDLVECILGMAEVDQVPVYARTSCMQAVRFYTSIGFLSQDILVFDNAPDVYILMWKPQPIKKQ